MTERPSKDPAERAASFLSEKRCQIAGLRRSVAFDAIAGIIRAEYRKETPRFDCPNSRKLLDTWKRRRGDLELLINDLKDDLDEFDGMIEVLKESIRGHENDQD